jgi:hypothetical protein
MAEDRGVRFCSGLTLAMWPVNKFAVLQAQFTSTATLHFLFGLPYEEGQGMSYKCPIECYFEAASSKSEQGDEADWK